MKTQVKNWLRWGAAGAFGLMLTLNVMVSLDFKKDKLLSTFTLVELGSQAIVQSESGDECDNWLFDCDTFSGERVRCVDGPDLLCSSGCDASNLICCLSTLG